MDCGIYRESMRRGLSFCLAFLICCLPAAVAAQQENQVPETGQGRAVLIRSAFEALAADSLSEAERLFRQALVEAPQAAGNELVYEQLAAIQERMGREQEALESYGTAIGLAPTNLNLQLSRASLYMKMEQYDRARADYDAVLAVSSDHPEALLMRAFIFQEKRSYKEARADYEKLLRTQPDHEQAMLGLALTNAKDRRPREALDLVNRCVERYPTHAAAYALRAGFEAERQQYELAEADYAEAIQHDSENASLYLARAQFLNGLNRTAEAREDIQRAARLGASAEEIAGALGMQTK